MPLQVVCDSARNKMGKYVFLYFDYLFNVFEKNPWGKMLKIKFFLGY